MLNAIVPSVVSPARHKRTSLVSRNVSKEGEKV
jgi:hypothetical protein